MNDETKARSAGTPDNSGHPGRGGSDSSPLQARASFIKNWDWQSVVSINRGTCERAGAQHGFNSEAAATCQSQWESFRTQVVTLGEAIDFLYRCHRWAPFLFFNGNTFAAIGRQLAHAIFSDLPSVRLKEVGSAVAHRIAGVLSHEAMVEIIESLSRSADLQPSDRVKTLRGSLTGTIVKILKDGRVVWRPAGSGGDLTSVPEGLVKVDEPATPPR